MRTFSAVILMLDGKPDSQGDIFDPKGLTFLPEVRVSRVPGSSSLQDVVGHAKLRVGVDGNLYADAVIYDFLPGPTKLYPSVEGTLFKRVGNVLAETYITGLGLTVNKNSDARIEPVDIPAAPAPEKVFTDED